MVNSKEFAFLNVGWVVGLDRRFQSVGFFGGSEDLQFHQRCQELKLGKVSALSLTFRRLSEVTWRSH